jgi:hypothetical protein
LRQSEFSENVGGPSFHRDVALDLDDNAGLWDLPDDEQGREVARQFGALQKTSKGANLRGRLTCMTLTMLLKVGKQQPGGFWS